MTALLRTSLFPAVLACGIGLAAAQSDPADPADPVELEPLIVEGERGPLDSRSSRHRRQLPCIGSCEEEADQLSPVARLLRDIESLFIASSLPDKPHPQDSLGVVNPVKARLDDKLP